jgi:serine/threonine protein kinase
MGPTETSSEPFGTVGYVAPEVLRSESYGFKCDLWSIGCIFYALLSGSLPYDSDDNNKIIKQTLNNPLVFDLPVWKFVSSDAKNLISGLLEKDPVMRLSLD